MRRTVTAIIVATLVCLPCGSADKMSWNLIRYVGGTVQVKTSRYDWNTTVTVTNDAIVVEIAPVTVFLSKTTVRLKPSQVLTLSSNEAAWRQVAAVDGAQLPAKHPSLFGLLLDSEYVGLVYDAGDGKRGAVLVESQRPGLIMQMLRVLSKVMGKSVENAP